MALAAKRRATYEDLLALPADVVGQIVDGELVVHPRPASMHAVAITSLNQEIGPPFSRGRGGPGGWVILFEPELHLGGDVVVPDLAGWRRERMPEVPVAPWFDLAPDWIAEGLSPSTEAFDRGPKLRVYARERFGHVWLLDAEVRTLEVLRLDDTTYRILAVHEGDARVRAEPFDAIELELGLLWAR